MCEVEIALMITIPCVIEKYGNICGRKVLFYFLRFSDVLVVFNSAIFKHLQVIYIGISMYVVSLSPVVAIESCSKRAG